MAFDVTDFLAEGPGNASRWRTTFAGSSRRSGGNPAARSRADRLVFAKSLCPAHASCRDSCAYCTFAKPPRAVRAPYMSLEEVLTVAERRRERAARSCCSRSATSRSFVTRRRPIGSSRGPSRHIRLPARRRCRGRQAHSPAAAYQRRITSPAEMSAMREVSVSQGLMLELISPRLCEKGGRTMARPTSIPPRGSP